MTNTETATATQITLADRDEAARWARPRTFRQYRGTGAYPVTIGGYVVGEIHKIDTGQRRTSGWAHMVDGAFTDLYRTRRDAVDALARTDAGVDAYRAGARDGAFGTAAERAERARIDALIEGDESAQIEQQFYQNGVIMKYTRIQPLERTAPADPLAGVSEPPLETLRVTDGDGTELGTVERHVLDAHSAVYGNRTRHWRAFDPEGRAVAWAVDLETRDEAAQALAAQRAAH